MWGIYYLKMVKKKKSKFENIQKYIRSKKSTQLKKLAYKFRNELLDLETPAESIFKAYLIRMRVKFEFQKIVYAGTSFYIVDFYIPRGSIVFEIDGTHHFDQITADNDRTLSLKKVGIHEVYRFNNEDVFSYESCVSRIKDILQNEKVNRKVNS